jgi:hypothetical protein
MILIETSAEVKLNKDAMGRAARHLSDYRCYVQQLMEIPMQKPLDNTKACPTAFVQDSTLVAVIEMSLSSWLVAGMIPGVRGRLKTGLRAQPRFG